MATRTRAARSVPTVSSVSGVRRAVRAWRRRGERVAFVPTMGFLHEGHLSLVRRAARGADRVVVSVFVNPLQFGPREDFAAYPRDWRRDRALLAASSTDLIFTPRPRGYVGDDHVTRIEVDGVARPLEGRARPGHFAGVATVVAKLLHAVEPDELWLGQKDAQQVAVVGRMIEDLDFPTRLRVGATVRERDGLALSSRNVRLSPAERAQAPLLHRALRAGRAALLAPGRGRLAGRVRAAERAMARALAGARLGRVDYAAVVDARSFEPPVAGRGSRRLLLLVAVRFPSARLIDNLAVTIPGAG